jgi:hypothetical protein
MDEMALYDCFAIKMDMQTMITTSKTKMVMPSPSAAGCGIVKKGSINIVHSKKE